MFHDALHDTWLSITKKKNDTSYSNLNAFPLYLAIEDDGLEVPDGILGRRGVCGPNARDDGRVDLSRR